MKRILCIMLCAVMALTTLTFIGCDSNEAETLKLGLGVYTDVTKASDANEDTNGQGTAAITAAAVTVDADGKIVACVVDTADITVAYTADGKAVANDSFATKYELGESYGMKLYGGSAKEWYEQADAFCATVKGKTLDEVKALVAEGNKGNDEVIAAGCTIMINDFVLAVEKAYNSASDSDVTASHTLKLGAHTEQTCKDANEDANGQNQIETTFFAAAVDGDGKVVASCADCVQVAFTFDANGASAYDLASKVSSKREAGENYGMSQWGADLNGDGVIKEWFEQADAFCASCVGKSAGEIASLMGADNYGSADVQSAGCTILVNGFVKAASKIGK